MRIYWVNNKAAHWVFVEKIGPVVIRHPPLKIIIPREITWQKFEIFLVLLVEQWMESIRILSQCYKNNKNKIYKKPAIDVVICMKNWQMWN